MLELARARYKLGLGHEIARSWIACGVAFDCAFAAGLGRCARTRPVLDSGFVCGLRCRARGRACATILGLGPRAWALGKPQGRVQQSMAENRSKTKVAVVLSGCGYLDGAEVQEAVLTLYFLDRAGVEVQCFAPDREQMHVVDHQSGEVADESRNVLVESARICRGGVRALDAEQGVDMDEFDALVMPGGFGVAKNLSDFALKGAQGRADPELTKLIAAAWQLRKPILAICISPAIVAQALQALGHRAKLTIGNDPDTAKAIADLGCAHSDCAVEEIVVDEEHRIISTPAYMLGPGPAAIGAGIEAGVDQLLRWLKLKLK